MLPLSLSSVFGSFTVVLHLSLPVRGSPSSVTAMVSSHCGKLAGTALSTRDSWEALHSLQFTTFHPGDSLSRCTLPLRYRSTIGIALNQGFLRRLLHGSSRICSSPLCSLGSAPAQPDPPPSLACLIPRVSVVTTSCSILGAAANTNASSQTDFSSRRPRGVKDRNCWLTHYRSVSTRSVFYRGIPLTVSPPSTYIHQPYRPLPSGLALERPLPFRKSFCHAPPPHVTATPVDQRSEPALFLSSNQSRSLTWRCTEPDAPIYRRRCSVQIEQGHKVMRLGLADPTALNDFLVSPTVSQPMYLWGILVSLINILKIYVGFTVIFTETYLHSMPHLSFVKKLKLFQLPVASPESSPLSSFTSFSPEKRSVLSLTSFSRSVSPPNVKWRCISISIIVCLSCGSGRWG
ncbi:hypothetical protein Bca52824_021168 [Brassica carinata]|uniref:Uncharacterized protein n=1 Tax=Brassica carinata TaxID=52824 RepID=A0A8X7VUR2_BRACI|nr:hypothetical protein Bca52824_021168 [Brassica carinata]